MIDYQKPLAEALSAIKNLKSELVKAKTNEDIAIIGVNIRFPQSSNLEQYWHNLVTCKEMIVDVPESRWDWQSVYGQPDSGDKTLHKQGGFIADVDKFDPLFFGISPKEAKLMDPQQRLALESTWHCIEDAGYAVSDLEGSCTGVYYAVSKSDYEELLYKNAVPLEAVTATGLASSIVANRLSYLLKLNGPSFPIDTACSGSLIAMHTAVKALHNGDCDVALVGAVNLMITPTLTISFDKAGMLSPDCRSRAFDASANGYARGEGVCTVMLKPLSGAEHDGDHIYGIIKGSAINHGGYANSLTAPNADAQKDLIVKAVKSAGIRPETISYIEAHGTGTRLGDPIEMNGIRAAFDELGCSAQHTNQSVCGIGSVKANMGHLEAAAGLAGIVKVLLSMRHQMIPGNPQLNEINPYLQADDARFEFMRQSKPWLRQYDQQGEPLPLRAGISSFGFGGAYGHVVLEEYMLPNNEQQFTPLPLFLLSARDEAGLCRYIETMKQYLEDGFAVGNRTKERLCQLLAQRLNVNSGDLDDDVPQNALGLDATTSRLLASDILVEFDVEVPAPIWHSVHFINDVTDFLITHHTPEGAPVVKSDEHLFQRMLYTSQVGREGLKQRLAVVCRSVKELYQILDQHLMGKSPNSLAIDATVIEQQAQQLADAWVDGKQIDFKKFYKNKSMRKLALPGYPFARNRYWFEGKTDKPNAPAVTTKPVTTEIISEVSQVIKTETQALQAPAQTDVERLEMPDIDIAKVSEQALASVKLEISQENIAIISLCGDDNVNMFSDLLVEGLQARLQQLREYPQLKVVVLKSEGRVFSMGGTTDWLFGIAKGERSFTDAPVLFQGLLRCPVPVVTAIDGHAFGGGMLLGLYADIPVLSSQGLYSANFMKYGFTPGMGATFALRHKLGQSLAMEMMFSARDYRGEELKNRGAGVMITEQSQVLEYAMGLARDMAQMPLNSLKALKHSLSGQFLEQLAEHIEYEAKMHREVVADDNIVSRLSHLFNLQSAKEPITQSHGLSLQPADLVVNKVADSEYVKQTQKIVLNEVGVRTENTTDNQATVISTVANSVEVEVPVSPSSSDFDHVCTVIREVLCDVLHLDMADIDLEVSLKDLGLDSINSLDLAKGLSQRLSVQLTNEDIHQFNNVLLLAEQVCSAVSEQKTQAQLYVEESAVNDIVPEPDDQRLEKVKHALAVVLHLQSDEFDEFTSLRDLGLDSINSLDFARELTAQFNVNFSSSDVYHFDNCLAIAQSFIGADVSPSVELAKTVKLTEPQADELDLLLAEVANGSVEVDMALEQL